MGHISIESLLPAHCRSASDILLCSSDTLSYPAVSDLYCVSFQRWPLRGNHVCNDICGRGGFTCSKACIGKNDRSLNHLHLFRCRRSLPLPSLSYGAGGFVDLYQ